VAVATTVLALQLMVVVGVQTELKVTEFLEQLTLAAVAVVLVKTHLEVVMVVRELLSFVMPHQEH
jgi:hypothetical protein